jgi:hypothetical protein
MIDNTITPDELRAAYTRAGLARLGLSFAGATSNRAIRAALRALAAAARRRPERHQLNLV